jgi:hypothetical protein
MMIRTTIVQAATETLGEQQAGVLHKALGARIIAPLNG